MANAATPQASGSSTENPCPGSSGSATSDSSSQDSTFECNICLDTAKDAVISLCGHLFWYELEPFTALELSVNHLSKMYTKDTLIFYLSRFNQDTSYWNNVVVCVTEFRILVKFFKF